MSQWHKRITGLLAVLTAMSILGSASAIAFTNENVRYERILVDMKQKDSQGQASRIPKDVNAKDFLVMAREAHTQNANPVPVQLLAYDKENGIAEIAFPLESGYIYRIKTTF